MSQDPNPFSVSPDSANPYSAPAQVGAAESVAGDVERIRRDHLSHEASIKGMGSLYVLGGFFGVLGGIVYCFVAVAGLVSVARSAGPAQGSGGVEVLVGAGIILVLGLLIAGFGVFQFWLGLGLRKLKPVVRIPAIVLSSIGLLAIPVGTIISGYFLYLVVSAKGAYILSPEYASVVQQTPHIKYKTSIIVWIFLGLLLFVIGLGVIGLIVSAFGA